MVLYSAVSSPLDRSKRFTLSSPGRPVHSDTVLGFSWKHSSHAAIDDFRGACAVKGNVQVAGRTSSVSTTQMLSTHDVTLRNVDGSLFHVQI